MGVIPEKSMCLTYIETVFTVDCLNKYSVTATFFSIFAVAKGTNQDDTNRSKLFKNMEDVILSDIFTRSHKLNI